MYDRIGVLMQEIGEGEAKIGGEECVQGRKGRERSKSCSMEISSPANLKFSKLCEGEAEKTTDIMQEGDA